MKSFNNNEMDFQEKLQKDTEIPVIVHERINQAYRMIENDTAMQKKTPKDPYHWMKIGEMCIRDRLFPGVHLQEDFIS